MGDPSPCPQPASPRVGRGDQILLCSFYAPDWDGFGLRDIIISGGENISSLEVEEQLYRHPGVMEAAVVVRPDDKWGEVPCAFVTLKPGAPAVTAEAIIRWCHDNLAHDKVPKHVVFGPLPKTSTGKIQKYVLREQARGASGWRRPPPEFSLPGPGRRPRRTRCRSAPRRGGYDTLSRVLESDIGQGW